mmetsp:Transcript_37513/g.100523  ORF Transcript_37513/g.100523 Transcript_37513/m.100523 type:complete len:384 (+) Transcript_37513:93-1244(+)
MFAVNSVPHAPDSGNLRSPLTPTSVGKSESCWRSDSLESGSQARSDEEQHGDGNGVKVSIKNTFLDLHAEETRDHPRRSRSVPSRAADVAMKEGAAPKCVAGEAAGCAEGRSLLPYSAGCSVRGGERDAALASDFASPGHAWLCGSACETFGEWTQVEATDLIPGLMAEPTPEMEVACAGHPVLYPYYELWVMHDASTAAAVPAERGVADSDIFFGSQHVVPPPPAVMAPMQEFLPAAPPPPPPQSWPAAVGEDGQPPSSAACISGGLSGSSRGPTGRRPPTPVLTEEQQAVLGSEALPTVGSAGHRIGKCKPCAFLYKKGCLNGTACPFCHLCEEGEKQRRQKDRAEKNKKPLRKQRREIRRESQEKALSDAEGPEPAGVNC